MAGTAVEADRLITGTAGGAGIFVAPFGTALPSTASAALNAAFYTLGYLTDDGVTPNLERDTQPVTVWQSATAARLLINSQTLTLAFTMKESAPHSMALFFGTSVPTETSGDYSLTIPGTPANIEYSVVIDLLDGSVKTRLVLNKCSVQTTGEWQINKNDAMGYPVTLIAFTDAQDELGDIYVEGPG